MDVERIKRRLKFDAHEGNKENLPESDAIYHCTKGIDKDGFDVRFISDYIGELKIG